ncbi:MAG: PH domain-containing protein [Thermoanaerobaculia bacterium]
MRFESKRDAWFVLLLRVMPLVVLAIVSYAWYRSHSYMGGPIVGVVLLLIFEIFFFESVMRSTYYVIEGGTLLIRSSVVTWRVPIAKIRSITPTRSAISSPAFSLDRLRILYDGKQVLVSPEEKQRFIEALRAVNPAIST